MSTAIEILEIRRGADVREYPLTKQMTTIGRLGKNDVVLNDSQVSREHARIERRNGILYITDLNSTNGTILNGARQ